MSLKRDLRSLQEGGDPEIHERVDLRAWTALGIGGLADLLIRCRSVDGLSRALDLLATHGQRWLVLGSGSRLVPPDSGLRVPVVNLSGTLNLWELDVNGAVAGGGAIMAQVCRAAARAGLSGSVSAAVSTGTVGGTVAAAVDRLADLHGILDWVETVRPGVTVDRWKAESLQPIPDLSRRVVVRVRLVFANRGTTRSGRPVAEGRPRLGPRPPRTMRPAFVAADGADLADAMPSAWRTMAREIGSIGGASLSNETPNQITTNKTARARDLLDLVRRVRRRFTDEHGIEVRTMLSFVDEQGQKVEA